MNDRIERTKDECSIHVYYKFTILYVSNCHIGLKKMVWVDSALYNPGLP